MAICEECKFSKSRPRGHIFVTDVISYCRVENARCEKCSRVKDFDSFGIIYRNFKGSEEYFKKVKEEFTSGKGRTELEKKAINSFKERVANKLLLSGVFGKRIDS